MVFEEDEKISIHFKKDIYEIQIWWTNFLFSLFKYRFND